VTNASGSHVSKVLVSKALACAMWAILEKIVVGCSMLALTAPGRLQKNVLQDQTCTIAAMPSNFTQLRIQGLWGKPDAVVADLGTDGTSITIARQRIANVELTATGTIDGTRDEIVLTYEVHYLGFSQSFDRCTATISKN
jgi:hypothetical protein